MTAPTVKGPRDLPDFREWLARQWQRAGAFSAWADVHIGPLDTGPSLDEARKAIMRWERSAIERAALWWVSADMVDLIEASCPTLPPVDLQPALVPAMPVVCVFERPLQGMDAVVNEHPVMVDMIVWDRTRLPTMDGRMVEGLSASAYRRVRFEDGLTDVELRHAIHTGALDMARWGPAGSSLEQMHAVSDAEMKRVAKLHPEHKVSVAWNITGEAWLPLGRTSWRIGEDWALPFHAELDELRVKSMAEDRRWLATLWSLASEPRIVDLSEHKPTRPEQRRAQRHGYSDPKVRVVDLRRHIYQGAEASREEVPTPIGRTYRVRWPVTGHWRNQAYGPGRAFRRPTYIAPYIKGPEGAPLRKGATVHVLRDDYHESEN